MSGYIECSDCHCLIYSNDGYEEIDGMPYCPDCAEIKKSEEMIELTPLESVVIRLAKKHEGANNALPVDIAVWELRKQGYAIDEKNLRELVKDLRYRTRLLIVCMPIMASFKSHGLSLVSPAEFAAYRNHYIAGTVSRLKQQKRDKEIYEDAISEKWSSLIKRFMISF